MEVSMLLAVLLAGLALGQEVRVPDLDAQLYRHPLDARGTLWTDDATRLPSGWWSARLGLGYARNPLVYEWEDREEVERVLGDLVEANLLGVYVVDRFRIGLDVPLYLSTSTLGGGGGAGLGDLALDVKASVLERQDHPLGLAFSGRLTLPTATLDAPVASPGVGWELAAVADRELGPALVALNLGTRGVPRAELDNIAWNDHFFYRIGGGYPLSDAAGLSLDLAGQVSYSEALRNAAGSPLEAMIGGWSRVGDSGMVVRGGVGKGLTRGIGAPQIRAVIAVGWEPALVGDADLDGIADGEDACPQDKEDRDGFEDSDGCPDLDNDGDAIVDTQDDCPDEPEDVDEHRDWDGCPEDGVQVVLEVLGPDDHPVAGASVAVEGSHGRWDTPYATRGAALQELALQPGEYAVSATAEGYDPLTATFTVPDVDEEQRFTWHLEAPVLQVETAVPVPPEPARVVVTRDRIDIADKVYFETAKAAIRTESHGLLEEVAAILQEHPELLVVRIEGHTDSRGNDAYNLQLSKDRAASVRSFLVERGVAPERLEAEGFGETRPIDPAENAAAWEENRRVEFFIAERED